jgi:hypothetical protein
MHYPNGIEPWTLKRRCSILFQRIFPAAILFASSCVYSAEICPNWIRVQWRWFPACFTAAFRRVRSDLLDLLVVGAGLMWSGLWACSVWIKDLSIGRLSGGTWLACWNVLLQNICGRYFSLLSQQNSEICVLYHRNV